MRERFTFALYPAWFAETAYPSRQTQEDARSQSEAWRTYDSFLQDERILFQAEAEPEQIETIFRRLTSMGHSSSQQ